MSKRLDAAWERIAGNLEQEVACVRCEPEEAIDGYERIKDHIDVCIEALQGDIKRRDVE